MKRKTNKKVYIPLILVIALVLGGCIYWYVDYSRYITSDDAHVDTDNAAISSKMIGRISQELVQEGDSIKQGKLVVVLDSTDLFSQKKQAIAAKMVAEASVSQAEAKYESDLKNNKVLEISLRKAQDDFERAKSQRKGDVISQEQYEHAKKALEMAQAQLDASESQAKVSKAQINSTRATVENAKAQINVVGTQINNTKLYASCDGVVAKRWLLPGDIAQAGQSILTIVNDQKLWISVFLEETKLGKLHIGQPANFTLDTYPGVTFTGKITTIGSNTASQFSLIPASNASGNFTKVTQRVQLKISIDGVEDGGDLSSYHILSGMSAVVKIVR